MIYFQRDNVNIANQNFFWQKKRNIFIAKQERDDYCYCKINYKGKSYDIEEEIGIWYESYGVNESRNIYCLRYKQIYSYSNGYYLNDNNCKKIDEKINCNFKN